MRPALVFFSGLFLGLAFLGGYSWIGFLLSPLALYLGLGRGGEEAGPALRRPSFAREGGRKEKEKEKDGAEGPPEKPAFIRPEQKDRIQPSEAEDIITLSREERRRAQKELEEALDGLLLDSLGLLREALPQGHTFALFLPTRDGRYFLRVWMTPSDAIVPGCRLGPGQGLVGRLLKEGEGRVLEGDIVTDSTFLHYYSADVGVKSLLGVPLLVHGARRGALVVDSLEAGAFSEAATALLESYGRLAGELLYQAYMAHENGYQRDQLVSLTQYQRKFLENMSEDIILGLMQRYMEQAVEGERHFVAGRSEGGEIVVLSCRGQGCESLQDYRAPLDPKALLTLCFEKEQAVNRRLPEDAYVPRIGGERPEGLFRSLLAVPVQTDRGVAFALVVESRRPSPFSEHQKQLLLTVARAAGFALSRARLFQEKELLANRDGLTGVLNHRAFKDRFLGELLRANRYGYQIAILMLDIDHFKKVNDTFGHPAGDKVLREAAAALSSAVRAGSDLLARYGGEEFVCMLVDTDMEKTRETAERIRSAVEDLSFEMPQGPFRVTLSIGVALYPQDGRQGPDLLARADKALYRAKQTGRNRVVFYHSEAPASAL